MSKRKSNLTLVIDGNWLLMSRYAVLANKFTDDHELAKEVQKLMLKSIMLVIKQFPIIDNIIFVSDGGSWRNDVKIPEFIIKDKEEENLPFEYKGQRKLSEDVDWKIIFGYYEELIKLFNENGITACKKTNIEGDDWCWYWSTKLNNEGTNVIIWSMDKDLTQLVNYNLNNYVFTVCWNDRTGLFIPHIEIKDENELDFFFTDLYKQNNINLFENLCNKCEKITEIDTNEVVVNKIIRGDKGDNIFPILLKKSTTNPNKTFRVSNKDIDITLNIKNDQEIKEYIHNLVTSKRYNNKIVKDRTEEEIFEHFKYNYKLIVLTESNYPKDVLDEMEEYSNYTINNNVATIFQILDTRQNNIDVILENI